MKKYLQEKKKNQQLNITGTIKKRSATISDSEIGSTKSFPVTKKRKVSNTSSVEAQLIC